MRCAKDDWLGPKALVNGVAFSATGIARVSLYGSEYSVNFGWEMNNSTT